MPEFVYVMTYFFLLLGPKKLVPAFAWLTRDAEPGYRRKAALYATLFATLLCAVIALLTNLWAAKYHLSLPSVQITAGLILIIWSLDTIFRPSQAADEEGETGSAVQLALSPLATPTIVTPAGVAAIMVTILFASAAPDSEKIYASAAIALAVVMALNFLTMYFIEVITSAAWLLPVLRVLGAVLVVVQAAFGVQVMLNGLAGLGVIEL